MKVVNTSELEGIAYIQVNIQRDNKQLVSTTLSQFSPATIQRDNEQLVSATLGQFSPAAKPVELHWQQQLEAAQNVLF